MSTKISKEWFVKKLDRLNNDDAFVKASWYFDGSILFTSENIETWIKIYKGQIIDVMDCEPALGSTFELRGDQPTWEELFSGNEKTKWGQFLTKKKIIIRGNLLESSRMMDALNIMIEILNGNEYEY